MKKLVFSSLALGTLAAAAATQPTAATASDAVFLTENEMDWISAGHGGSLSVRDLLAGDASALVRSLRFAGDASALARNLRTAVGHLDAKMEYIVERLAVGAIAGAAVSHPIAAHAAQPMRLAEAAMDGITAGASLTLTTGASVTAGSSVPGAYATVRGAQEEKGRTLSGGGSVITGHGVVIGDAYGSTTSGSANLNANASGDLHDTGTFRDVVNVPNRTIVIGATWGYAIDLPPVARH